jgi:curved DNA-binding protein CbpA
MECNKDEAQKAMGIAERKFTEKDLIGAKKFALKAQALFPPLEGISQFITALDVHLMAQSRVSGEKDWYGVMSLSPSADESAVRKQYRHLVLQLHPDKNHAKGAEAAFKIVQEAFEVLKDKNKRQMYDQKRKTHGVNGHSTSSAGFSVSNGFKNQEKGAGSDMSSKVQVKGTQHAATQPASRPPKRGTTNCSAKLASQTAAQPVKQPQNPNTTSRSAQGMAQNAAQRGSQSSVPCTEHHKHRARLYSSMATTFWTRCTSCRMWFEYSLLFQSGYLFCWCCRKPFYAADAGQPVISYKFEELKAWKHANLVSAKGSGASSISNQGSSQNMSASSGSQQERRPDKRMRGEGSSNANEGS